jgi:hypothetical protein
MVRQGMEGSLPAGSSGFSAFGQVVIEVVTVRA